MESERQALAGDGVDVAGGIADQGDAALYHTGHPLAQGTGPAVEGNLNAPRAVVHAAVIYVLRSLVAERIPLNGGCLAPVEIRVDPLGIDLGPLLLHLLQTAGLSHLKFTMTAIHKIILYVTLQGRIQDFNLGGAATGQKFFANGNALTVVFSAKCFNKIANLNEK